MARKKKRKIMNVGHSRLFPDRRYKRSDTKKEARYSIKRDLKQRSPYLPARGKPFTGDNKKILYNPRNAGEYIVLSQAEVVYEVQVNGKTHKFKSKRKAESFAKKHGKKVHERVVWKDVNYGGKKKNAVSKKEKYKSWKVGYI